MVEHEPHTDPDLLRAFALGMLGEHDRAAIERHIDGCDVCFKLLETTAQNDTFVTLLRRANGKPEHPCSKLTIEHGRASVDSALLDASAIAGFELLEELGRGGMGVVYKARQVGLNRFVAIKTIRAGSHASPEELTRFHMEAEAVARLLHPNIVQVHENGRHESLPYLVLEFVQGGSLKSHLTGLPMAPRVAARLVECLALGVSAAHREGIVHRDLKPANILLAPASSSYSEMTVVLDGTCYVPKITDFGLARRLGKASGLTETGAVLGTPEYMAPEQARGDSESTAVGADVYGLGAILYELLTGRPPFRGLSNADVLLQVIGEDPLPPSRLQAGTPRDLEAICLKCLRKDAHRRFASALELAEDLAAYREGRPTQARLPGICERTWLWVRRRPAIAALLALVFFVSVLAFALVTWQWHEADSARQEAAKLADNESAAHRAELAAHAAEIAARQAEQEARRRAEADRFKAQTMSAGLALDQGIKHCEEGRTETGLLWMARALELAPTGQDDLEHAIRANLAAWKGQIVSPQKGTPQGTPVTSVAISPDGKKVLCGNWGNVLGKPGPAQAQLLDVEVRDAKFTFAKQPKPQVFTHPGPIWSVAFSGDGKTFALGGLDGTTQLCRTDAGKPIGAPLPHGGPVYSVSFSPDGKLLAIGGRGVSTTEKRLLGGEVRFWNTDTWDANGPPVLVSELLIRSIAWSPNGQSLLIGGALAKDESSAAAGGAVILDVAQRKLRQPLLHADVVTAVAFHPDGTMFATACHDGKVRFFDAQTGRRRTMELSHRFPVKALTFSKDGRVVATSSGLRLALRTGPGEAHLWDATTGRMLVQPLVHGELGQENTVHAVALSDDGRMAATASECGVLFLWTTLAPPRELGRLSLLDPVSDDHLAFSPDGRTLLWASQNPAPDKRNDPGSLRQFDVVTGRPTGAVLPHTNFVHWSFSSDGRRVLTVSHAECDEHWLGIWDMTGVRPIDVPKDLCAGVRSASFSPDGRTLLIGGMDGNVRIVDSSNFVSRCGPFPHGSPVIAVVQSPDGRLAMSAGNDRRVCLWDLESGQQIGRALVRPGYNADAILFTADSRIAVVVWRGTGVTCVVRYCVDPSIHALSPEGIVRSPDDHVWESRGFAALAAHSDGKQFLMTAHDGMGIGLPARLWSATTGVPQGMPLPARYPVALHPSGRFLAVGGTILEPARFWSVAGKPIGPVMLHAGQVHRVLFDPSGKMLATVDTDHICQLWQAPDVMPGSPAVVRRTIEKLTGLELDEAGGPRELNWARGRLHQ